ncbi:MAG: zinc ribbon domain-containing protein [Acidobacteriota bacterium]
MSLIQFVANYDDLSTDRGYQFKFHCDKCGNGFMSSFQPSAIGIAGSLLRAAGSIFGGIASSAGNSAYEIQRAVGGTAHDHALGTAVEEGKKHFKQCTRCGRWVCPEVCWNAKRSLCEGCAPDEGEELAAAQAQVTAEQIFSKARETDMVAHVDMKKPATAACPQCGAATKGGKFCPECGANLSPKGQCPACGADCDAKAKFCPECGQKM